MLAREPRSGIRPEGGACLHQVGRIDVPGEVLPRVSRARSARVELPTPTSQIPVCASNLGGSRLAPRADEGGWRGRGGRCSRCSTGDAMGSQASGGIRARIGRRSWEAPGPRGRPVGPSGDGAWTPRGLATERAWDRRRTAVRRGGRSSPMTGCNSAGNPAARQPLQDRSPSAHQGTTGAGRGTYVEHGTVNRGNQPAPRDNLRRGGRP